jgi:hypothetical protein
VWRASFLFLRSSVRVVPVAPLVPVVPVVARVPLPVAAAAAAGEEADARPVVFVAADAVVVLGIKRHRGKREGAGVNWARQMYL